MPAVYAIGRRRRGAAPCPLMNFMPPGSSRQMAVSALVSFALSLLFPAWLSTAAPFSTRIGTALHRPNSISFSFSAPLPFTTLRQSIALSTPLPLLLLFPLAFPLLLTVAFAFSVPVPIPISVSVASPVPLFAAIRSR